MRNNLRLFKIICAAALILTAGLLPSCVNNTKKSGRLSVVTSVYPVYDFACKIAGDNADVTLLVPAGAEPHDWEPRVSDIAKIENADIFIYSGAGLEHWVSDVLSSVNNKNLLIVDTSERVQLIEQGGDSDPHIWLDPGNAQSQMAAIQAAFAEKASAEDYHFENYMKYSEEFDKLREEYNQLLTLENKNLVTIHSAFGYLCRACGLTQTSVEGLSPEGEPSAAKMAEIAGFVKENNVRTIFYESEESKATAQTIAREAGAGTEFLNTLEWLTKKQIKAGEDYFSVMRDNLKKLLESL